MDRYDIEALKELNRFLGLDEMDGLDEIPHAGYIASAGIKNVNYIDVSRMSKKEVDQILSTRGVW